MSDWIEWKGGACPVAPETVVEIKTRKDLGFEANSACTYGWEHDGNGGDIIAYRVVSDEPTPIDENAVFPQTLAERVGDVERIVSVGGMTKREIFAGMAMMGMGAWMPDYASRPDLNSDEAIGARAKWAVRQADALIAALKDTDQ